MGVELACIKAVCSSAVLVVVRPTGVYRQHGQERQSERNLGQDGRRTGHPHLASTALTHAARTLAGRLQLHGLATASATATATAL